jgi:Mg-chelatase subunit ChlD
MVFVLDVSGSMGCEGYSYSLCLLPKLKTEFSNLLDNLQGFQWFSIVTFSTGSAVWKSDLQHVNPANIAAAKVFVNGMTAGGGTQYKPALEAAYDIHIPSGKKLTAIYFLSDGDPNKGDCTTYYYEDCYKEIYKKDPSVYINTIQLHDSTKAQKYLEAMAKVTHGNYRQSFI